MRWTEPSSEATSVRPIQPVHGDAEVHRDWFGGPSVLHDVDYGPVWMQKAADKTAGVTLIDADETGYDMATSKPRRHTVRQHIRSMYELPGSYSADSGVVGKRLLLPNSAGRIRLRSCARWRGHVEGRCASSQGRQKKCRSVKNTTPAATRRRPGNNQRSPNNNRTVNNKSQSFCNACLTGRWSQWRRPLLPARCRSHRWSESMRTYFRGPLIESSRWRNNKPLTDSDGR